MKRKTMRKHTPDALQSKSKPLKDKGKGILPRKVKQPSKSTIKRRAWDAFSKFIRTRDCIKTTGCPDWGLCITCSRRYHIKLLQAGHFIPGRHNANLFSEKGTHAQCYNCNINLRGATLEYRRKIIEMYGDGYDEVLEQEAREIKKYSVEDLTNIEKHYKIEVEKFIKGSR
uniref:Putative lambda recombination protein n=1 Tax=viral metagenome TaxID=1070528 RepID=A0A6M3K491_9ZZZZ